MINKVFVCLRCEHLREVTTDKTRNHTIVLAECANKIYGFPRKSADICPYFKEKMKGENDESRDKATEMD